MRNFCIFADAVNFIEENLCEDITQEDIAAACCCSLSALQKVWRFCSHTSLKEYISKRRLTRAAEDIVRGEATITEIAVKYGYNSPEVFSRAFVRLWGVTPSAFKNKWHSTGIFPKIVPDEEKLKGGVYMGRRVDISELYEMLKSVPDSYVLCFDIVGLDPVNKNIGRGAGDLVIREAFARIDAAAGENMTAFRIGGDEFALVTGQTQKREVIETANKVLSKNGGTVDFEGREITVSLRAGAVLLRSEHLRYSELFDRFQRTIDSSRDMGIIDITELFERLKSTPDSYVLCFDVVGLDAINKNEGCAAGNLVIKEAVLRINAAAGEGMTAFRLGGDEFALVTGQKQKRDVIETANKVLSKNGGTIEFEGREIPVSVRAGAVLLKSEYLRGGEIFDIFQETIDSAKNIETVSFCE